MHACSPIPAASGLQEQSVLDWISWLVIYFL